MDKQEFIKKIAGCVQKYAPAYGILVHSPIIAQAILESGWGESRLAAVYHNYFGLKCGTKWTREKRKPFHNGRIYAGNPYAD